MGDDYYPEGIDKAEFDAMVAEEMARLEREARMVAKHSSYGADDYGGSYGADPEPPRFKQAYAPEPSGRVTERYVPASNLPRPPAEMSPRDLKREKQAEYARMLQQDQDRSSRGASRENSRGARRPIVIEEDRRRKEALSLQLGVPKPVLDIFGNAAVLSGRSPSKMVISDEQKVKLDKQKEYARQLQSDRSYREQQTSGRQQPADPRQRVGSGRRRQEEDTGTVEVFALKGGGRSDSRSKSEKQQDYARQLEEDRYLRDRAAMERGDDITPRQRVSSGRRSQAEDEGTYSGLMIGGASDSRVDRNSKRRQQEEYAAQLKMQSSQPPDAPVRDEKSRRHHAEQYETGSKTSIQLGGYDISTTQRISNKRAQQREYSEELNAASNRAPMPSVAEDRKNRLLAENSSSGNSLAIGSDASTAEQRHMKISEQRRYNRELEEAANAQAVTGPSRKAYARQVEEEEHPLGYQSGGGLFGGQESTAVARNNKKAAQEKYSQQLRADQDGIREPNLNVGRGYEQPRIGSPGQHYQDTRRSDVIISGRDKGFVGLDRGSYSGPGSESYSNPKLKQTEYYRAEETMEQFRPVAVSDRVRDYKDRQVAYANMLAQDAEQRDSARASSGMDDEPSNAAQARKRATSTGRLRPSRDEVDYTQNQGTGLMIGGMDLSTAYLKENKKLQQQQYAQDIANAKSAIPVPDSYRSVHREHTEYMGNGLPGGRQIPFRDQPGSKYHNDQDFNAARNTGSRQKDFQLRGASTGGGRSQISF